MTACGVHGCVAVTAVTVQNSLGVTGVHLVPAGDGRGAGAGGGHRHRRGRRQDRDARVAGDHRRGRGRRRRGGDRARTGAHAVRRRPRRGVDARRPAAHRGRDGGDPHPAVPARRARDPEPRRGAPARRDQVTDAATAREAAEALYAMGPRYVLVKGGHLRGSPRGRRPALRRRADLGVLGPRIDTPHVHGAGDALASATCAALARGLSMPDAVASAERYIRRAVAESYPSAPASARCRRSGRSSAHG